MEFAALDQDVFRDTWCLNAIAYLSKVAGQKHVCVL